jgi:glycosyltransferase involved in cell wall biosynthesis
MTDPSARDTIGIVTTSPFQVALFLRSHLDALPPHITPLIFTNTQDPYRNLVADLEVRHVPIGRAQHVTREDVRGGVELRRALRAAGVRTVVTMSPKAGFIGQLAARGAGVEHRLHIFTGQVWQGMSPGPRRFAVRSADKVIGRSATHLAADSLSQAAALERAGIAPRGREVAVPHPPGSIRGVDLTVFRPRPDERAALRSGLGLDDDTVAFVQVGRIARAKGVLELVEAFRRLRADWSRDDGLPEPRLFILGQDEESLEGQLVGDGVRVLRFTEHPESVLAAMDVGVLASHREGFGSSIIEAAAVGLPSLGTDIIGIRDAIVPGATGWLVPRRSAPDLYAALAHILQNRNETQARGAAALARVQRDFGAERVAKAWADHLMAVHCGSA